MDSERREKRRGGGPFTKRRRGRGGRRGGRRGSSSLLNLLSVTRTRLHRPLDKPRTGHSRCYFIYTPCLPRPHSPLRPLLCWEEEGLLPLALASFRHNTTYNSFPSSLHCLYMPPLCLPCFLLAALPHEQLPGKQRGSALNCALSS